MLPNPIIDFKDIEWLTTKMESIIRRKGRMKINPITKTYKVKFIVESCLSKGRIGKILDCFNCNYIEIEEERADR
jgi:hypothetical protein